MKNSFDLFFLNMQKLFKYDFFLIFTNNYMNFKTIKNLKPKEKMNYK